MNELIASASGAAWIYPLITLCCLIDGVFPPVPSEIMVVAAASLAATVGEPNLVIVMLCAALGAAAGDITAYAIGRYCGVARLRRRPKIGAMLDSAADGLSRRTAATLLTARFVPVGRIVANFGAGAFKLPLRRFVPVVAFSAVCWSVYTTVIGISVGPWLSGRPILAVGIAIALSLVVGFAIDVISTRIRRRSARTAVPRVTAELSGGEVT